MKSSQETFFATLVEPMVLHLLPKELLLSYNQIILQEKAGTISMLSGDVATTSANERCLATVVVSFKLLAQLLRFLQLEVESREKTIDNSMAAR